MLHISQNRKVSEQKTVEEECAFLREPIRIQSQEKVSISRYDPVLGVNLEDCGPYTRKIHDRVHETA